MSHKTVSKTQIKNLDVLKRVAERAGCKVTTGKNLSAHDSFITITGADMIIEMGGSKAGLVPSQDGSYSVHMDNYGSRLAGKFGYNLKGLHLDYAKELVRGEADAMGGMIDEEVVTKDGWTEIHISVP